MSEGIFNSASIVSTSGLQSRPGALSLLPPTLVLIVIFIGGGCYSTSGGIKFFRIGGMYSLAQYELNLNFHASFTAVIAAITNAGPLYAPEWSTGTNEVWPSYADMLTSQKTIITVVMLLGRLEVIAVIASLTVLIRGGR